MFAFIGKRQRGGFIYRFTECPVSIVVSRIRQFCRIARCLW